MISSALSLSRKKKKLEFEIKTKTTRFTLLVQPSVSSLLAFPTIVLRPCLASPIVQQPPFVAVLIDRLEQSLVPPVCSDENHFKRQTMQLTTYGLNHGANKNTRDAQSRLRPEERCERLLTKNDTHRRTKISSFQRTKQHCTAVVVAQFVQRFAARRRRHASVKTHVSNAFASQRHLQQIHHRRELTKNDCNQQTERQIAHDRKHALVFSPPCLNSRNRLTTYAILLLDTKC